MNHAGKDWHEVLSSSFSDFLQRSEKGEITFRIGPAAAALERIPAGHFHIRSEAFLQISGTMEFTFPDACIQLMPGELLVVPPRLFHQERVQGLDGPCLTVVLYADSGHIRWYVLSGRDGRPDIVHVERSWSSLAEAVALYLDDAAEYHAHGGQRAQRLCRDLMRAALAAAELLLARAPETAIGKPSLISRCRALVLDSLGNPELTVKQLAGIIGCSTDYLSHLFCSHAGEPLVSYINRLRMSRAAELLRTTPLLIKEVAWTCGFSSESYFIRRFGQRFGMTPLQYRAAPYQAVDELTEKICIVDKHRSTAADALDPRSSIHSARRTPRTGGASG